MSVYVHAQASAASLQRTLNLSANKYYYYYFQDSPFQCLARYVKNVRYERALEMLPTGEEYPKESVSVLHNTTDLARATACNKAH